MKIKFLITLLFSAALCSEVFPQVKWTIDDCIRYALENNIGLQRQKLQTEINQVNLTRSKMQALPNLNFGTDARVGFGRSVNPVTNLITFKQNLGNSYSLSSDINLFNGLTTLNTIEANKFMLKAGIEIEKIVSNSLIIDLLGAYYQVLYCHGLEEAAKMQLDLSEKQLFRISKTVETGKEALSRKFEIESRVSEDKLAYTIARNNTHKAITFLKQILQLEAGTEFEIIMPDLSTMMTESGKVDTDSIYAIASVVLPRLKAINYQLQAMKKQVAASRGAIYPSLSVGGAIYTGYYAVLSDPLVDQDSYSKQMKNNNSQAVYASLRIPLFNKYTTGRNIKLAKINLSDTELQLQQEKNIMYSEIETACVNLNSGEDEYYAALSSLEFNKKSFEAVEKKFEAGLVDVTDYSEAKTKLFTAETETVRTKLQMLVRRLAIKLYCTGEYESITQ
jgi:outer membrane protein TolC